MASLVGRDVAICDAAQVQAQGKELADACKGSAGLALTFCSLATFVASFEARAMMSTRDRGSLGLETGVGKGNSNSDQTPERAWRDAGTL